MSSIVLPRGAAIVVALVVGLAEPGSAHARTASADGTVLANGIRPQDEIILVNVRPLGSCCDPERMAAAMRFESYLAVDASGRRRWQASTLESVQAADPSVATVIFVHGNRLSNWDAKSEGLGVYRRMACQSPSAAPLRFVIFSWPSAQIRGPLKDVRAKAARTGPAGCQLAWFVDQLPEESRVTLVGFSFGARIITGSLHILGGGSLGRYCALEPQHPGRRPVNVVLLAAALHADWLAPGRYHGLAMSQVDQMLLLNNCSDPAMKYYRFVTKGCRPQALGCCGPMRIDTDGAAKITQRNVRCYVGREHNLFCYLSAPGAIGQIWEYAGLSGEPVAGL
jgi:hypothetical protein